MKTALVTGASGFIGSHICTRLYEDNYNIIAQGFKGEIEPKCNYFLKCDLDLLCKTEFPKIDVCFHQAANNDTLDSNLDSMIYNNVTLPSNLFSVLYEKFGCRQFVYASSFAVYGNQRLPYCESNKVSPLNSYGQSKVLFEKFATDFKQKYKDINIVGLRYTNVYGAGEKHKNKRASMITQIYNSLKKNESPKLFKYGEQKRDWVYIDDVVSANILAMECSESGIYNVGSGESLSFLEIYDIISDELNSDIKPIFIDCLFEKALQKNTLANLDKISKLGFKPKQKAEKQIREFIKKAP